MVQYSASQATRQITIAHIQYTTALTINAPSDVEEGASFNINGKLTFMEGGVEHGLGGETINLSYNGTSLGSAVTDGSGNYSKNVSIADRGTFTLTASFGGSAYGAPAQATFGINIEEAMKSILAPLLIISAGIALISA